MEYHQQLKELLCSYETDRNPLHLFEALLLCLGNNIAMPDSLANWLTSGLAEYLSKNYAAKKCQGSALLSTPGVTVIEQFDFR